MTHICQELALGFAGHLCLRCQLNGEQCLIFQMLVHLAKLCFSLYTISYIA
ncbi:hypothetical protein BMS3Bbin04_01069 [bacterium BMS3Bbin04]|nr:hypothetical protein BMS3Bbin04_01069 [bacterium BMS3Bbin04]